MMKMFAILAALIFSSATFGQTTAVDEAYQEIRQGLLDWIIVQSEAPGPDSVIIVRRFDASDPYIGSGDVFGYVTGDPPTARRIALAQEMQANAPGILAERLVEGLNALDYFAEASLDSGEPLEENFITLEGRFTSLAPGRRPRGNLANPCHSGVFGILGWVKDANNAVLAEFRRTESRRAGRDTCDAIYEMERAMQELGDDIAIFLQEWSSGGSLTRRRRR